MNDFLNRLTPDATHLIRLDHAHVFAAFRQFEAAAPAWRKKGLADNVCLALEIHTQLEEEIFYPALRLVTDSDVLRESPLEHEEMRTLITRLRFLPATDIAFEGTFHQLMRQVLHHVADEETLLLPAAQRLLAGQLQDLGRRMTSRRLELAGQRAPEMVSNLARSFTLGGALATGSAMLAGAGWLARQAVARQPGRPG